MAWDSAPPTKDEIDKPKKSATAWDSAPPSDVELSEEKHEEPGLIDKALTNVVVPVGRFVDSYAGAPSRSALDAALDGKNPVSAFTHQFGDRPENAPTGKEIAQKVGLGETKASDVAPGLYSEKGSYLGLIPGPIGHISRFVTGADYKLPKDGLLDPTASGAAGLGIDIAADWTNLIPGALALKGVGKTGLKAGTGLVKGATKVGTHAVDLVTGTKAATNTVEATTKLADRTKEIISTLLNPKRSKDYEKSVVIAKKHGIDPAVLSSAIEFGPTSTISRLERNLTEGATGAQLFEKHRAGFEAIEGALEKQVSTIGQGAAATAPQAGEIIVSGFNKAQADMLGRMEMTYAKAGTYAPGLRITRDALPALHAKLGGIERYAKGLIKRGVTGEEIEQGNQLLRAVGAVRQSTNYKQHVEAMQRLGKHAFGGKPTLGQIPVDKKKLQELYWSMSDAALDTVKKDVNPEFAKEILRNNEEMSAFFKERSTIQKALESGDAPERVFQRLVTSGDTKSIGALKKLLPAPELQKIKGAFINGLLAYNKDGLIEFGRTANAIRKKQDVLGALLDPKEMESVAEVVKLGTDYGEALLSHSGTGASNSFRDFGKGLLTGFRDEKALEMMKSKARGGATPGLLEAPKQGILEPPQKGLLERSSSALIKARRGPKEQRLKAAQSVSPSQYTREEEQ